MRHQLKLVLLLLSFAVSKEAYSNGCTGSIFTIAYSPNCGCWQICNAFISDCNTSSFSVTWDFGDGTPPDTGIAILPCHVYSQAGTYTVTMRIQGNCHNIFTPQTCLVPRQVIVDSSHLNPVPIIVTSDFTYNNSCFRSQILFTEQAVAPTTGGMNTFTWDFGDGTFSNALSPAHVFPGCGTYEVSLVVAHRLQYVQGCCYKTVNDTSLQTIYIDCATDTNKFVASLDLISPLTCNGNDAALQATAAGGTSPYSYSWSDGSSNSLRSNLPAGTYSLTVSETAGCHYDFTHVIYGLKCIRSGPPKFIPSPFPIHGWR